MSKPQIRWLALLLLVQPAAAEVTMPALFQSGGVLQRDKPVPVWGRAPAGKAVMVSFAGQNKTATADASGRWQVFLDAMPASAESRSMTVTEEGSAPLELTDILVGEVWLGSGQSNMQWTVEASRPEDQAIAAAGPVPLMRLFDVPRAVNHSRQESVKAEWTSATPETAKPFSAVAYFFGKQLAEELKIPIGMIHSSWGGSRIEPWWAEEGLASVPELAETRTRRLARSPGFPEYDKPFRSYVRSVGDWSAAAGKALDAGLPPAPIPAAPELMGLGHTAETGTYQAMIHPLVPYALRGFLWYQGESNNGEGMAYTAKKKALIAGWRQQFQAAEAPFLFVQLAPYNYGEGATYNLPGIWWAQQETLKVPHTGMAVTNDIGNVKDIHPTGKAEVGRRLSLWALADTYGKKDLVKSGPLLARHRVTRSGIEISFDHTGGGLATRDGQPPSLFEVAGTDMVYHPAMAKISDDGKSILLTSAAVPKPDRARFAWSQLAEPNLINREGLPAPAFNTHWPVDPTLGRNIAAGKPHQSSHPNTQNWDSGLTDGKWGNLPPHCYATGNDPTFPKTVTIDLGALETVHHIAYGTPDIGATKTVAISLSEDGGHFTEIHRNAFPAKKASATQARFTPQKARFIRATFVDSYPAQDSYGRDFGFLSELEVYAP